MAAASSGRPASVRSGSVGRSSARAHPGPPPGEDASGRPAAWRPRRRAGAQGKTPASRQRSCLGAPVRPSARCWVGRQPAVGRGARRHRRRAIAVVGTGLRALSRVSRCDSELVGSRPLAWRRRAYASDATSRARRLRVVPSKRLGVTADDARIRWTTSAGFRRAIGYWEAASASSPVVQRDR